MTIKELCEYLFSGAKVKLVHEGRDVFIGRANELTDSPYGEYEVNAEGIQTLSDNIIRISITKPQSQAFPQEFDSYEVPRKVSDRFIRDKIPIHVRINNCIQHYYSKEKFYSITIETMGLFGDCPEVQHDFVSESILLEMYNMGKED